MLVKEPVFNTLRTKEQLGYSVFNTMRYTFGVLGYSVTVNPQVDKFKYVLSLLFFIYVRWPTFVVYSGRNLGSTEVSCRWVRRFDLKIFLTFYFFIELM